VVAAIYEGRDSNQLCTQTVMGAEFARNTFLLSFCFVLFCFVLSETRSHYVALPA
jgi:preprotein translocase subunit SecG